VQHVEEATGDIVRRVGGDEEAQSGVGGHRA
jgi:hypothetical protein